MHCADVNWTAALLLASTALCSAQTNVNPRALLEEIAASERGTRVWHAEGVEIGELTGEGMNLHTEIAFKAVLRDPTHVRWETTGDNRTLVVCDGANHWTYSEPGTGFYRSPVEVSQCTSQLPAFDGLLDHLVSVTSAGGDHVPFEGASRDCDSFRAEYSIPASTSARVVAGTTIIRTLCIEPMRKSILRDRTESWATGSSNLPHKDGHIQLLRKGRGDPGRVLQVRGSDRHVSRSGSANRRGRLPRREMERIASASGVSRPQLIRKVDPSWTDEARQAGISGLVLVSFTVDFGGQYTGPDGSSGIGIRA